MRIALDPGPPDGVARVWLLHDDGIPLGPPDTLPGLGAVAALERRHAARWVFARPRTYRQLLGAEVEVARAHDVEGSPWSTAAKTCGVNWRKYP